MKDEEVFAALCQVEKVVEGTAFSNWRKGFVAQHVDEFSYEDENKLEYTAIHEKYEEGVEEVLRKELLKGFAMEDFMGALPAYFEGPGAQKEETARAVTMLLEISDFTDFKNMMLYAKRQKEEATEAPSADAKGQGEMNVLSLEVDGLLDMCAALADAGNQEGDAGWERIMDKPWISIWKKDVEESVRESKSQVYMKGIVEMKLTYLELVDAMLYFGERRKLWDPNFGGVAYPNGGDYFADNDCVMVSTLDFGMLMHLIGVPRQLSVKLFKRWDYPKQGMVTFAMVPWDVKKDILDKNNAMLSIKCTTLYPHPTDPNKSFMSTLEINKMGGMPTWALNMMMSVTAPSLMKGIEQRYSANIRKKDAQKTIDLTPEGRANRAPGQDVW
mmetsp:Transcript_725/g.1785  ORF Transcript_725/g.1785 Transcript_725/m.1785 type:complete len:386 (-) Transcript_725:207-1364(-)